MRRKRRIPAEARRLGKQYAEELRLRAQLMRTPLMLTTIARDQIARDLEELAYIAEKRPECFRHKRT